MTKEYPEKTFGQFLTDRKEFITIDDLIKYKRIRVQLHWKGLVERDVVFGSDIKTKKQQVAKQGELLVAEIDAKVGGIGIVPPELNGAIVSSHYFLYQINEDFCLKEWLNWFIRSGLLSKQIKAQGSTNYAAIRPDDVLHCHLPLPSIEEQHRILSYIATLSMKIEEAKLLRKEVDEKGKLLMVSSIKQIFMDFAMKWGTKKIGTLCETTSGGTPSRNNPDYFNGSIPWVKSGELNDDYIIDTEEKVSEIGLNSSNAKIFPKGTFLVALYGATVGRTAILDIESASNQAVCAIFPKDNCLENRYLQYYFFGIRPNLICNSFGGAQPNISQKVVKDLDIPIPPLDEQCFIVSFLDSLQSKVNELRNFQVESQKELNKLLPSLLDKAFKGEI
jgi:type I restriction enzyme S subunit